jgi:hypothetical protein
MIELALERSLGLSLRKKLNILKNKQEFKNQISKVLIEAMDQAMI